MDNNRQNDLQPTMSRRRRQAIRAAKQRRTLLAIALCFALVLIMFLIILCGNLIASIRERADSGKTPDDDTQTEQPGDEQPGEETPDEGTPEQPSDPTVTDIVAPATLINQGSLLLVNDTHEYISFQLNSNNLINIYDSQAMSKTKHFQLSGSNLFMEKNAYNALNKMLTTFSEQHDNKNILIRSAYRSYEDQIKSGSSVRPGYSDSHTGLSCELKVYNDQGKTVLLSADPVYDWIYENCHKYGFVVRYPDGKEALTGISDYNYYFRYVGYVHAYVMKTNGMCLEEYISYVRGYSNEAPLSVTADDGTSYEIYYVPAAIGGMDTLVPVPVENAYTISGDNEGGFIITVTLPQ